MPLTLLALIALVPVALVLILMAGLRWPANRAMPLGLFIASTLSGFGSAINVLIQCLELHRG